MVHWHRLLHQSGRVNLTVIVISYWRERVRERAIMDNFKRRLHSLLLSAPKMGQFSSASFYDCLVVRHTTKHIFAPGQAKKLALFLSYPWNISQKEKWESRVTSHTFPIMNEYRYILLWIRLFLWDSGHILLYRIHRSSLEKGAPINY